MCDSRYKCFVLFVCKSEEKHVSFVSKKQVGAQKNFVKTLNKKIDCSKLGVAFLFFFPHCYPYKSGCVCAEINAPLLLLFSRASADNNNNNREERWEVTLCARIFFFVVVCFCASQYSTSSRGKLFLLFFFRFVNEREERGKKIEIDVVGKKYPSRVVFWRWSWSRLRGSDEGFFFFFFGEEREDDEKRCES